MADLLPDSRASEAKGRIFTPAGAMVPFFCANCGKHCGHCAEENMTFMFYLCNPCFETHGYITGTMVMPDEVFWQRLKDEQLESYGHILTPLELEDIVKADASPLATLIKEAA